MRDLNYQLKQLGLRNRDGSFATRSDRERILSLIANQLHELGFKNMRVDSLKPKHIDALIGRWQSEGIAIGTLKNRMSALRWWSQKIGKDNIIARDNAKYGIGERQYVTNISKAKVLDSERLARISDPYTRMSLQLQSSFGLRKEESIKIVPTWADGQTKLKLRASWCKGGRARTVPILTQEQRVVLDAAKQLAGRGSLIPKEMSFKDQLQRFKSQCASAGVSKVHGFRHHYAQSRYEQLTGWKCPASGGPIRKQLTPTQREIDRVARLQIASELGHGRQQIVGVYCGC